MLKDVTAYIAIIHKVRWCIVLQIQVLETKDTQLLARLNEPLQTFRHQKQPDIFAPYNYDHVEMAFAQQLVTMPGLHFIVSVTDTGKVTGYASYQIDFQNHVQLQAEIHELFIMPQYEKTRSREALLSFIEKSARINGAHKLLLNYWQGENELQDFCRVVGFQPYRVQMEKKLS